jgi:hypothetical protein
VEARDVPYAELGEALMRAQETYPDATSLKEVWTPNGDHAVHVEVWRHWDGRGVTARVVPA